MFIALDTKNNTIPVEEANKFTAYSCPYCGGELFIKEGDIRAKHFAHKKSESSCIYEADSWGKDSGKYYDNKSEWHRSIQNLFSPECQEVYVKNSEGVQHRADILYKGVVIEVQSSPISQIVFDERTAFYRSLGYRVLWIFKADCGYVKDISDFAGDSEEVTLSIYRHIQHNLIFEPDHNTQFAFCFSSKENAAWRHSMISLMSTDPIIFSKDFRQISDELEPVEIFDEYVKHIIDKKSSRIRDLQLKLSELPKAEEVGRMLRSIQELRANLLSCKNDLERVTEERETAVKELSSYEELKSELLRKRTEHDQLLELYQEKFSQCNSLELENARLLATLEKFQESQCGPSKIIDDAVQACSDDITDNIIEVIDKKEGQDIISDLVGLLIKTNIGWENTRKQLDDTNHAIEINNILILMDIPNRWISHIYNENNPSIDKILDELRRIYYIEHKTGIENLPDWISEKLLIRSANLCEEPA